MSIREFHNGFWELISFKEQQVCGGVQARINAWFAGFSWSEQLVITKIVGYSSGHGLLGLRGCIKLAASCWGFWELKPQAIIWKEKLYYMGSVKKIT